MAERTIAEVFPPGEFIREELEARQLSQIELAEILGRYPKDVNELIMGKRSITAETAKALGSAFGTSAQYWMNLESGYQLWRTKNADDAIARRSKLYQMAPMKEMIKRHWIEPSENIEVLEKRILKFFGISTLDETPDFRHAARRGAPYRNISSSQLAWLFRARHLASAIDAEAFSERLFKKGLERLRGLLRNVQEIRHVPRVLAESGIRLLIVEHLPQTKIDGATFWLDPRSPVIVLSVRYDRIDWFWHTLCHELGHVKCKDGLGYDLALDTDLVGKEALPFDQKTDEDREADQFATNFLVERTVLEDFIARISPLYGKQKMLNFANLIKVHPGIVVGQLQFRGEIQWSYYRQMLDKVRHIIIQSTLTDGWGHLPSANL